MHAPIDQESLERRMNVEARAVQWGEKETVHNLSRYWRKGEKGIWGETHTATSYLDPRGCMLHSDLSQASSASRSMA